MASLRWRKGYLELEGGELVDFEDPASLSGAMALRL